MIVAQESIKKSHLLEKLHVHLYVITFCFVFVGLFTLPKGHEVMEIWVILSLLVGALNCLVNRQVFVAVPKLWLGILLIAGLVITTNHFIHGDWDRYGRTFFYLVFFVIFRPNIPNVKIKKIVLYSAAIGGIFLGLLSLYQFRTGMVRVEGFTNAIPFSQGLLVVLIFNLYFFIKRKDASRYLSFSSICFLLIGLYLSQTRGVWLALLSLVFIYLLIKACRKPLKYLVMALVLVIISFSAYENSGFVRDKVASGVSDLQRAQNGEFGSSWGLRIVAWDSAIKDIKNNPLIGVGRDNFFSNKEAQAARGDVSPLVTHPALHHAHNQYLQSQLIRGIPGTIALLFLLSYPFIQSGFFNNRVYLFKSIAFAYAVYGLTDVPFEHLNTIYLYTLSMTLLSYFSIEDEAEERV